MPVPSRPIFDAENPMYCARTADLGAQWVPARPTRFMRKLLRLQSAQQSPLKARRLTHTAAPGYSSLPSSQASSAVDAVGRAASAGLPPGSRLLASPSPIVHRTSKSTSAPAIVLTKAMLLSPPQLLVPPVQAVRVPSPFPSRPRSSDTCSGLKRKRSSDSGYLIENKRARGYNLDSSSAHLFAPQGPHPDSPYPHTHLTDWQSLPSPPWAHVTGFQGIQASGGNLKGVIPAPVYRPPTKCADPKHNAATQLIDELERELYGFDPGAESMPEIEAFVDELDANSHGALLKQQLQPLSTLTHQDIANLVGEKGHFTPTTLALFRRANVETIDLRYSLSGDKIETAENIDKTLEVFTCPQSFALIHELNLNDVPLTEESLILLQPLRSTLLFLWLKRTGMTDAMFPHLVCHRKLKILRLTGNDGVTDESITNLLYMTSLNYLELDRTSVTMEGLRKFSEGIISQERKITLEIPEECEAYMNTLHTQYLLHPVAPFISDPGACGFLSLPALKNNLAEHAKYNADVQVKGSKGELCEALRTVLERRKRDMMVRAVLWQQDGDETVRSGLVIEGEEGTEREDENAEEDLYELA